MQIKSSTSFSLLEIVIAILILSLVVAGMFGLFVNIAKIIVEIGHRSQAVNLARKAEEHGKVYVSESNTSPAPDTAGTGPGCALENGTIPLDRIGLNPTYTLNGITYTFTPDGITNGYLVSDVLVGGNPTGLKEVEITVQWTEP